jgi:hypothetical protein
MSAADLNAIALASVTASKDGHPRGFAPNPAATAADFEVGQVVSIYSRGYYRTGVVEKVGRKNVTVLYFTETSVREGTERLLRARARSEFAVNEDRLVAEDFVARVREVHAREQAEGCTYGWADKFARQGFADIDAWAAAHVADAVERAERRTEAALAGDLAHFSNDTRKADAFNKIGVRA